MFSVSYILTVFKFYAVISFRIIPTDIFLFACYFAGTAFKAVFISDSEDAVLFTPFIYVRRANFGAGLGFTAHANIVVNR